MKKKDCNFGLEWDYKGIFNTKYPNGEQTDWNQTLMTCINEVSNNIHAKSLLDGATHIEINSKLLPLIKSMTFYNENDKTLANYYVVINEKTENNIIMVYNKKLMENIELIPIMNTPKVSLSEYYNDEPMLRSQSKFYKFTLRRASDCSPEARMDYMRNLCGYIEIKNF